ncbi:MULTISPECIES: lipoyl synthase [unclassified Nitratiruptor]|uniref:lipoyl synthase n=1 Tax=unclassified Nitratiruptor TaxID=2624044 RepID=UPI0019169970|nr:MULTISPECIES: lipoyl synthase [unclassified Nitratiruptor]BCD60358.1 lipoyl synthase [Nitratiruptor sp. YY08-10]BCD64153.1 lipoyl synthase [Nitratiruptor sp. YY08-14]
MVLKPKVKAPSPELIGKTQTILNRHSLNTICIAAKCPNIAECYARGTATFLILGNICTRRCKFCNVFYGKPFEIDETEPKRIAQAVKEMELSYVVITSVDRDDLSDFGSKQFFNVTKKIQKYTPNTKIELLTPDFQGHNGALQRVIAARPYKLAHNIETVERLFKTIKSAGSYKRSLSVLETYAKSGIKTKSSVMVGLGETKQELLQSFQDLANAGVSQLTIGQYLQPSPTNYSVQKYYTQAEYDELAQLAKEYGIKHVVSGILVRSSYYAEIY